LSVKTNMELEFLQKKYPEFVYDKFEWNIAGGDLVATFDFFLGDIEFNPSVTIRGIDVRRIEKIGKPAIDSLVFNMGLAEIPSYWKAACPPRIVVRAGYLDKVQADFWSDLIANMGQFFYENNLPFIKPKFYVVCAKPAKYPAAFKSKPARRYLVPMGGGKDSLVTLEVLREAKNELKTFTLNANMALKQVISITGQTNIFVERRIDKKIIELNNQGYLNGHTPFSSILAVLGVCLAALFDCRYVAISQERSSNEGNAKYRSRTVNHQYTKTFEFENKFRRYSRKYLAANIDYFSFLRPLYEIQIAEIFSRYPEYF
jgi:UDP-N-acetyl-alpha-D-muramoyl-L-alanyl-L-glutamate epimerase